MGAAVDLSQSSLAKLARNYTAGEQSSLTFNLTDSFGNMISDEETARALLNTTSLQLLLKTAGTPGSIKIPWKMAQVGFQGIGVNFTSNQTGRLRISLILGREKLSDLATGNTPQQRSVSYSYDLPFNKSKSKMQSKFGAGYNSKPE